jgi:hypothetical protein
VGAAQAAPGAAAVRSVADGLVAELRDVDADTPAFVGALVAAGAAILEVRREAATLEEVYFEVMGAPADGAAAA